MKRRKRNDRRSRGDLEAYRLAEGLELMDDNDARYSREDARDRRQSWYGFQIEEP